MKIKKYSLIVLLIAGATLSTYAQEESEGTSDADRAARRAAMIAQFDADGDGVLSAEELETARAARQGRRPRPEMSAEQKAEMLATYDADGDGVLSAEERETARAARQADGQGRRPHPKMSAEQKAEMLATYDADGDGVLSEEEREAARAARQASQNAE